ncbi:MAG: DUF4136 domain-containing protein [bacterium]|nr:DUF4136 domain-containing protein [bacterium]
MSQLPQISHPAGRSTRSRPIRARHSRAAALLAGALAFLLAGCQSAWTEQASDFDFATMRSYAWRVEPTLLADERGPDDDLALKRLQQTIDSELRRLGVRPVAADQADMLVDARLTVTEELQRNDPNFALYVAEKYEEGGVSIEFLEPGTNRSLWFSQSRARLRYTARAVGSFAPTFSKTDEERVWQVEPMVRKLLRPLGDQ